MRQIAGEVGVQAGALYNYTPDKQSLLFRLMHDHMLELLSALGELPVQKDPTEALRQFIGFHIRFHLQRPDEVFIAYMELRNLTSENFAQIEILRRQYEDILEGILKSGQKDRIFSVADTKIATLAVIAMLNGVMTWYRTEGRLTLDQVEGVYWDMVRRSVTE